MPTALAIYYQRTSFPFHSPQPPEPIITMPPINTLHKSLVDVALGATAFLCNVDRRAIPVTRTIAVLVFCIVAWVSLVALALSSAALIGGDSPTERFSELAPVIVLSSPLLWAALRRLQILLEVIDTLFGSIALAHAALQHQRGVFDTPQSFVRTGHLHVRLHTVQRTNSPYPRASKVKRHVHFGHLCESENSLCENALPQVLSRAPNITSEFCEDFSCRWESEIIPLGALEGLFIPRHLHSDIFVSEKLSHDASDGSEHAVSGAVVSPRSSKSGVISKLPYAFRWINYIFTSLSLRTPNFAVPGDARVAIDNVQAGWLFVPVSFRAQFLLRVRRASLRIPALVAKYLQGTVSVLISLVDALIGETGGLILVAMMEFAHPLLIRRKNANYILRGKGAVVADVERCRDIVKSVGRDRYLMFSTDSILFRTLMTVFRKRVDLVERAIVMLHVGCLWRQKPKLATMQSLAERHILLGDTGGTYSPKVPRTDICAMAVPSANGSLDSTDTEKAASSGYSAMVLLSGNVANLAAKRGHVQGVKRSGAGGSMFAGLCEFESAEFKAAKESVLDDFCDDGWLTGLGSAGKYNAFELDEESEIEKCILMMIDVCMDSHASAICSTLSSVEWVNTSVYAKERHFQSVKRLQDEFLKFEQLDFLVSCHRNEIRASAWLFVDEVLSGDWVAWQMWCIVDAFELCKLVCM